MQFQQKNNNTFSKTQRNVYPFPTKKQHFAFHLSNPDQRHHFSDVTLSHPYQRHHFSDVRATPGDAYLPRLYLGSTSALLRLWDLRFWHFRGPDVKLSRTKTLDVGAIAKENWPSDLVGQN